MDIPRTKNNANDKRQEDYVIFYDSSVSKVRLSFLGTYESIKDHYMNRRPMEYDGRLYIEQGYFIECHDVFSDDLELLGIAFPLFYCPDSTDEDISRWYDTWISNASNKFDQCDLGESAIPIVTWNFTKSSDQFRSRRMYDPLHGGYSYSLVTVYECIGRDSRDVLDGLIVMSLFWGFVHPDNLATYNVPRFA